MYQNTIIDIFNIDKPIVNQPEYILAKLAASIASKFNIPEHTLKRLCNNNITERTLTKYITKQLIKENSVLKTAKHARAGNQVNPLNKIRDEAKKLGGSLNKILVKLQNDERISLDDYQRFQDDLKRQDGLIRTILRAEEQRDQQNRANHEEDILHPDSETYNEVIHYTDIVINQLLTYQGDDRIRKAEEIINKLLTAASKVLHNDQLKFLIHGKHKPEVSTMAKQENYNRILGKLILIREDTNELMDGIDGIIQSINNANVSPFGQVRLLKTVVSRILTQINTKIKRPDDDTLTKQIKQYVNNAMKAAAHKKEGSIVINTKNTDIEFAKKAINIYRKILGDNGLNTQLNLNKHTGKVEIIFRRPDRTFIGPRLEGETTEHPSRNESLSIMKLSTLTENENYGINTVGYMSINGKPQPMVKVGVKGDRLYFVHPIKEIWVEIKKDHPAYDALLDGREYQGMKIIRQTPQNKGRVVSKLLQQPEQSSTTQPNKGRMVFGGDKFPSMKSESWNLREAGEHDKGLELMQALADAVHRNAHTDPFLWHIASDPNEMTEFLMAGKYVVQKLHPEEREFVASSPEGIKMLLDRMVQDYKERSPEYRDEDAKRRHVERWGDAIDVHGENVHPAHTPSGRKLIELTIRAFKERGRDPKPYLDALVGMMLNNGRLKTDHWASDIHTPEEMYAKFVNWRQRRLI